MPCEANQLRFHEFFQGLDPDQRDAVTTVLDMQISGPFLAEGYKRFLNMWRVYRRDHDQQVSI
jgi:hypothetical protein